MAADINPDDYRVGGEKLAVAQNEIARLSENLATHPYLVKRIYAIQRFHDSEQYRRLAAVKQ